MLCVYTYILTYVYIDIYNILGYECVFPSPTVLFRDFVNENLLLLFCYLQVEEW
jgi:hypothetical protein